MMTSGSGIADILSEFFGAEGKGGDLVATENV
jgi:hypothetical protein